jgi:hypothetical protein
MDWVDPLAPRSRAYPSFGGPWEGSTSDQHSKQQQ